jgi:hypothetical protein
MHTIFKNRHLLLFIAVFLFILVPPFIPQGFLSGIIITILLSIVTIQSVYILVEDERKLKYGYTIGFVVLAVIWITHFLDRPDIEYELTNALLLVYFTYILYLLMRHMVRKKNVDINMILIAVTVYLLFAIAGGFLFAMLDQLYDNAFNISGDLSFKLIDFIYYSFVTITTLGYGDVLPLREETRIPAAILATGGQFYIALVIAVLVSKYSSTQHGKKN